MRQRVHAALLERGVLAGLPLARWYPDDPELREALLVCATEVTTDGRDRALRETPSRRSCADVGVPRRRRAASVAGMSGAGRGRAPDPAQRGRGPQLQPTLAELSRPGRGGGKIPHPPADALAGIPPRHRRAAPLALPELNEPEVVRHFVNLSHLNYSVDGGFYPLGSCTMKYNPKLNEWAARLPGFAAAPPAGARRAGPGHAAAAVGAGAAAGRDQRHARRDAPARRRARTAS